MPENTQIAGYLHAAYSRQTINALPATPQFWQRIDDGTIWWDMDYLHNAMCNSTSEVALRERKKFLRQFSSLLDNYTYSRPSWPQHLVWQFATGAPPTTSSCDRYLRANICNTAALLTFCFLSVDCSRQHTTANFWLNLLHTYSQQLRAAIPTVD